MRVPPAFREHDIYICLYIYTHTNTCTHTHAHTHTHTHKPHTHTHTHASGSIHQHTLAYVSIRQHTSAYVMIRRCTRIKRALSAYVVRAIDVILKKKKILYNLKKKKVFLVQQYALTGQHPRFLLSCYRVSSSERGLVYKI